MLLHDPGRGHPERPQRLQAVVEALREPPVASVLWRQPKEAPTAALHRVHDDDYVQGILNLRGRSAVLGDDTNVCPASVEAALLAAGCAIGAVDAVVTKGATNAFALGRPPGHHAERNRAMGFCLFNNVAVAADHALSVHGIERVMIIDWDVHHGNGTQDIFFERNDVLFVSTHQEFLYPGTGALEEIGDGAGAGYTVNLPLPASFDDDAMLELFRRVVEPIARQYEPQIMLLSAGFDAHGDDPLGQLLLSDNGYAALTGSVLDMAAAVGAPLAFVLEGGYDLGALSRSVRACVEQLADPTTAPKSRKNDAGAAASAGMFASVLDHLASFHRQRWTGIEV